MRPGRFVLHNPAVAPVLRGEGERIGDRFELQSDRVEGLLARVRMRGFRVLTLSDQVAALPAVPAVPGPATGVLHLQTGDRLSRFAADVPDGWQELVPDADGRYHLPAGTVIRRRQGRGPARFALVISGGLRTLAADEALLSGYARTPPAKTVLTVTADGWQLAALALPTARDNCPAQICVE